MPRQTDTRSTKKPKLDWYADDLEMDCMSEDDFEMDEVLDDDDAVVDEEAMPGPGGNVPVWRLIEMSRENRYLERELADFDDYDTFENLFDKRSDQYAH